MIKLRLRFALFLCLLALMVLWSLPACASDKTIIDEWTSISIPTPPSLKPVVVDVSSTAFLILDIQTKTSEQRPRCAASVPGIADFLKKAREQGMTVIYSLTSTATPADIVSQIAPLPGDPVVKSSVDKFYNTDLDFILKLRGVKSVVIVGTAAHGAVLHTATAAAIRGYQVILPVDGMSAEDAYAEQYTAWHMLNSPGTRNKAALTKLSMIELR
ncbi:cysteine hydrolase [Sporomusa sp.]|uniref:cysteine hydrolase n=1 Tax=Sporomusa sp. TaxID=2078658 RepID=UPI002C4D0650|nr:cysteine hydrolase [Sporomusa sp.]HWR44146.1 cysteine hydrolase [Sporomusa sp.]